jgi:hypothetical protein
MRPATPGAAADDEPAGDRTCLWCALEVSGIVARRSERARGGSAAARVSTHFVVACMIVDDEKWIRKTAGDNKLARRDFLWSQ